ncbi:60 kDa SS-A/Ro ribonucleoprotein-like [Pecten maximus]|uniref:60 kDa SS-A/Ro ribonucleoprotein-like n=1 Tax=Pecten maximus TaxID=6579 RepID=UPI001458263A|nr:60 kDa SS-A/Ro ribonucleoprotein-like [Pecten maximus]
MEMSLREEALTSDVDSDKWRLQRFLILGSESGAYKSEKKEFVKKDVKCLQRLISLGHGPEVVATIRKTNSAGRCCHRLPVMYALAMCARSADPDTKKAAYAALQEVCPEPTDLLTFVMFSEMVSGGTGWGRAQRRAISDWYNNLEDRPKELAKGVTKTPVNNQWTHRDVMRLSHIKTDSSFIMLVIRYVTKGLIAAKNLPSPVVPTESELWRDIIMYFEIVEETKQFTGSMDIEGKPEIIDKHRLEPCHLSTALLRSTPVWNVLLKHIPLDQVIQNISKIENVSDKKTVLDRLEDKEELQKANVNPFAVVVAMKETEDEDVKKTLGRSFDLCVRNLKPTNKKYSVVIWVGDKIDSDLEGKKSVTARDAISTLAVSIAKASHHDSEIVTYLSEEKMKLVIPDTSTLEYMSKQTRFSDMNTKYTQLVYHVEKSVKSFDAVVIVMYTQDEDFKRRLSKLYSRHRHSQAGNYCQHGLQ